MDCQGQGQGQDGGAGGSDPSLKTLKMCGSDQDEDPFCIDIPMEVVKACMRRQSASGKPYLTDTDCSSLSTPDDTGLVTPSDIEDRKEVNSVCRLGCICESLYGKGMKRCQDQEPRVEAEVPSSSPPPPQAQTVLITTPPAAASVTGSTSSGTAPQPQPQASGVSVPSKSRFKFGTSPVEAEESFNQFRRRAPPGISFNAVAFPSAPKIFWVLATHERSDGATYRTRTPYYYEKVKTAAGGEEEMILRGPITISTTQTQACQPTTQPTPNQKVVISKRTPEELTSSSNNETGCAPPPEKKIQTSSSEKVLDSPSKDEEGNGNGFAGFGGQEGSATSKSNLNNNDAEPLGKVNGSDGLRCSIPGCTFQTVLGFWHLEQHQVTCAPNVDNEIFSISSDME